MAGAPIVAPIVRPIQVVKKVKKAATVDLLGLMDGAFNSLASVPVPQSITQRYADVRKEEDEDCVKVEIAFRAKHTLGETMVDLSGIHYGMSVFEESVCGGDVEREKRERDEAVERICVGLGGGGEKYVAT
jgi:hypothetical protein